MAEEVQGLAPAAAARAALERLGATVLFEKVLTTSDANGSGRIVIPKGQAELHFPALESQNGVTLVLVDTQGKRHHFRFRFWINNQSRMYLLENTQDVQTKYNMHAGDVLVFGRMPDGVTYAITGRRGTKVDVSRKPATKRIAINDGSAVKDAKKGAVGRPRAVAESAKSKRIKQKLAEQAVQSSYTYWSGYSLPARKDGVFRAVPNSTAQEGNKVVAQYGCWTAILSLGGELFQAFFDSYDAAQAAYDAAMQNAPPAPAPAQPAAAAPAPAVAAPAVLAAPMPAAAAVAVPMAVTTPAAAAIAATPAASAAVLPLIA